MKQFCAALLAVLAIADETTDTSEITVEDAENVAEAVDDGSSFLESAGDFFSSR